MLFKTLHTIYGTRAMYLHYRRIALKTNISIPDEELFAEMYFGRPASYFSSTSHIDTSTTFCPLITQTLRIISVRCIPLSLRSKTRRRATLLLPTWICSCQSVGTVNFILPFTTNVTISISILQTFRSWVATSHLRPPMAFLSHNLSDTPGGGGLLLLWMFYSEDDATFQ